MSAGGPPGWEFVQQFDAAREAPGLVTSRRRHAISRRSLAVSDVIAVFAALTGALALLRSHATEMRPAIVLLVPFVVLASKALGLYDADQYRLRKSTLDEAPAIFHLSVLSALFVWSMEALVLNGTFARGQVFLLTAACFGLIMICRAVTRVITVSLNPVERCLIVGNAGIANRTAEKLIESEAVKAVAVGRVSISSHDEPGALRVLGRHEALTEIINEHAVERVIIAPDGHNQEQILHCIRLVKALGLNVSVLPRLLEVVGSSSVFDDVDGIGLLGIRQYGLSKSSAALKRAMDALGAGVALVLLAPLFAVVAIAIRLDSVGSPFFRQPRVGRGGERFSMIKFRTMVRDADQMKAGMRALNEAKGGLFKISGDPRITRVGRFLRRTSLDQLPQLINVLRGEMSLVGPRPLVLDEDELIEGWERRRLAVKPGMTGMWQIIGSSRIPMPEMVKIDYHYGANWSIWLDLKILLRTVPYMLGRRGL